MSSRAHRRKRAPRGAPRAVEDFKSDDGKMKIDIGEKNTHTENASTLKTKRC